MKFLCLGYFYEDEFNKLSEAEVGEVMKDCMSQCRIMRASGKVIAETGLFPTQTAKCIRPKRGEQSITDGPFTESKEQLGSFFIVEADSMEEAVEVAAKHPAALLEVGEKYGWGIEVRRIQHEDLFG